MPDNVGVLDGELQGTFSVATKEIAAGIHAQKIVVVDFLTPNGDSMVDEGSNGLGVVLLDPLRSGTVSDGIIDSVSTTGLVAHGAALSSNTELRPVLMGSHGVAFGATPTPINAGALAERIATRHGIPWTLKGHPNQITREFHITAAKTDADLLGAIAATDKVVVTKLTVTLSKAATVNVGVRIGFGATTIPAVGDAGTGALGIVSSHSGIEPGGGFTTGSGEAPIGIGATGEELRITNDAPTTGSLRVVVTYFTVVES